MAKLFDLQYHEDPGPKGSLTKDAIAFLSGLAKELRTQNNYGNAEPRYFGLMHKEAYPVDEEHADGVVVINHEGETCFYDSPEGLAKLAGRLKEDIDGFIEEDNLDYVFTCEKQKKKKVLSEGTYTIYELNLSDSYGNALFHRTVTGISGLMDARDDIEYEMDAQGALLSGMSLQHIQKQDILEQDALFLTQKGAQDYLKAGIQDPVADHTGYRLGCPAPGCRRYPCGCA